MTEQELKRYRRGDLVQMYLKQAAEIEDLKKQLADANAKLSERQLQLENIGSIAEASLAVNGVFEAAQKAADQYIENANNLIAEAEKKADELDRESQKTLEDTRKKCEQMEQETEELCQKKKADTAAACEKMKAQAELKSANYWKEVSDKLESFYAAHEELKEMLDMPSAVLKK